MRALVVTGPADLRETLRGSAVSNLVTTAARLRPADPTTAVGATKLALRELARRVLSLEAELERLDAVLSGPWSPPPYLTWSLPAGVGTDTAGALLVAAGDNPQRLRSEAAFAHLCGVAPIDASSGLTVCKRLHRAGGRRLLFVRASKVMAVEQHWRDFTVTRTTKPKPEAEPMLRAFGLPADAQILRTEPLSAEPQPTLPTARGRHCADEKRFPTGNGCQSRASQFDRSQGHVL